MDEIIQFHTFECPHCGAQTRGNVDEQFEEIDGIHYQCMDCLKEVTL